MKTHRLQLLSFILLLLTGCFQSEVNYEGLANNGGFDPTRYQPGKLPPYEADEEKPSKIVLSMTPYYSTEVHQAIIAPIGTYLEAQLGIPIEINNVATYRELIDAVIQSQVDVALISPLAFILAKEKKPELELLAAVVAQGTTTYSGYLVAPIDSALTSLEEAKGKHLALVDPVSTSGSLFPKLLFKQKGINADSFFASIQYTGTHDKALALIRDKKVDLAAVSSDTLVGYNALGPGGYARIITSTGRAPYDAVVAQKSLPKRIRAQIRNAFLQLSIHSQEGRRILANKNLLSGFIPADADHYQTVEAAARAGGLLNP